MIKTFIDGQHDYTYEETVELYKDKSVDLQLQDSRKLEIVDSNDTVSHARAMVAPYKNIKAAATREHCVRFIVTDELGNLQPACSVLYGLYGKENEQDKLGETNLEITTNENGVCELMLPTGLYFFEFKKGQLSKSIRQLSIMANIEKRLHLVSEQTKTEPTVKYSQLTIPGT